MIDTSNIYYKQVHLLLEVLPHIAKEECFALKGGTAINIFIRDMPRLSVDIDLVYLPIRDRDLSLEHISTSLEDIAKRLEKKIKGIKVHRLDQRGDKTLSKLQIEQMGVRIKIETSPVMRGVIKEPSIMRVSPKVEEMFGFAKMRVVHFDDLYGGKICAALDRQHPRDFFDIKRLLEHEGLSDELFDTFIVYLISSNQSISKLLNPNLIDLTEVFESQFRGMTIKPIELEALIEARSKLIKIIQNKLTQRHKEFLLGFKRGEPNWELLPFDDVKNLPSIKWKMVNLDKMDKKKRDEAVEKLKTLFYDMYKIY